jgi:hypothetical protein
MFVYVASDLKIGEGENIIDNGDTNDHFTTVPVTS